MADVSTEVAVQEQQPASNGRQVRVVHHPMPLLDTGMFEHMQRVATVMADASLLPDHVRQGKTAREVVANCFLIVEQAIRWGVSPFGLGQHAYFVQNKLGFEGKVIAAICNADSRLKGRLDYEYGGAGDERSVKVSGTFADSGKTVSIEGTTAKWKTSNKNWKDNPDQMLAYRGAREWARRYMPDKLLGVYADDEIEDMALRAKDITPATAPETAALPKPKGPPPAPTKAEPAKQPATIEAKATETPEQRPAEEPAADPLAVFPLYLEKLDGDLAVCKSRADLDEVWASHVETSDGRISRCQSGQCETIFDRHVKRLEPPIP